MSVNLIATLKSKKEKLVVFTEIMEKMKIDLPQTKGCHSIQIFQDDKNPCIFTLLEVWETKEQHKAHMEEFVRLGHWKHLASHLGSEPVSGFFSEL